MQKLVGLMSGGALHSSQSSSSAEEGNLTVFHVRAVTQLNLRDSHRLSPQVNGHRFCPCFWLLWKQFSTDPIVSKSLVIWAGGWQKCAVQNQSHHPCLCLRLQKMLCLNHVSWVDRLVAFQLAFAEYHLCVTDAPRRYWKLFVSEISVEGGYGSSNRPNSKKSCSIYTSCKNNFSVFVPCCFPHLAMAHISACQWTLLFPGFCFAGSMRAPACDLATDL